MSLSSVCVVSNALRLRFFEATPKPKPGKTVTLPHDEYKPTKSKEEKEMEKTVKIEGMMCEHCVSRVKSALEELGVQAEVELQSGTAKVKGDSLDEKAIEEAIVKAGYEVKGIE